MIAKTFVHQLHSILAEPSLNDLIGWADSERDDDSFFLRPYHNNFPDLVLKKYFKHGNVSSFVRQLHMYGFHKLPNTATNRSIQTALAKNDPNIKLQKSEILWYFVHPSGYFTKQANKELLCKIQRKTTGVGKDGKRRNILSPVCVNFIDSNGTAIYSPQMDMYGQALPMNGNVANPMEIKMANQSNMMNRPYERSISCVNMPVNRVRTPVARTNSQPVIRLRQTSMAPIGEQMSNNGQRLSYSSIDSNSTYYNNSFNPNGINPLLNIPNNNNSQYHLQHQQNLPLQPTGNTSASSSVISFPYMNSITPPPPSMGFQQQQGQQPMFKQSVFHNGDHSPFTVDDGTTPQITRPSSISTGNNHPLLDPLAHNEINGGSGMATSVTTQSVPNFPQGQTLPSINANNNDEIQSKQWSQPRVTPISTNPDMGIKSEQTMLPKMSISSPTSATVTNPDASFQKISNIMKVSSGTISSEPSYEGLGINLQNLMKSIMVVTDILDKLHLSKDSSRADPAITLSTDDKTKEIEVRQIQLDQLLGMLAELRAKLINNNDIIAKSLNSPKELKPLTATIEN